MMCVVVERYARQHTAAVGVIFNINAHLVTRGERGEECAFLILIPSAVFIAL